MASHSMINESIFDLEKASEGLKRDFSVLENECELERLVGKPGSLYPENIVLWREYQKQLKEHIELVSSVEEKLNEELAKFG